MVDLTEESLVAVRDAEYRVVVLCFSLSAPKFNYFLRVWT